MKPWVCVGKIVAAHGIKGQVKIKTFTEDPENITKYGQLVDSNQRPVDVLNFSKNSPTSGVSSIANVTTRNQAELLKGIQLFVHQSQLPELSETEIYHESLMGLPLLAGGKKLGEVVGVYDFGAGVFCEIQTPNKISKVSLTGCKADTAGFCEINTKGKIGTIHLNSCNVFTDHLECDEINFLI